MSPSASSWSDASPGKKRSDALLAVLGLLPRDDDKVDMDDEEDELENGIGPPSSLSEDQLENEIDPPSGALFPLSFVGEEVDDDEDERTAPISTMLLPSETLVASMGDTERDDRALLLVWMGNAARSLSSCSSSSIA